MTATPRTDIRITAEVVTHQTHIESAPFGRGEIHDARCTCGWRSCVEDYRGNAEYHAEIHLDNVVKEATR